MAFETYDPSTDSLESLVAAIFPGSPGVSVVPGSIFVAHGTPENEASTISFYDGYITPLNIGAGLLLTTGDPTPPTKNTSGGYGESAGGGTDADLQQTVDDAFGGAGSVMDVTSLQFDLMVTDPTASTLRFEVVFCSEEYPEYSGTSFVDVGGIYVNGVNYGLFNNNPLNPLSVVTANFAYFRSNAGGGRPIEYDGISVKLIVTVPLREGLNTIKLAIGDTGDSAFDSAMFISSMETVAYAVYGVKMYVDVPDTGLIDMPGHHSFQGSDRWTYIEFSEAGGGQDVYNGGLGVDWAVFDIFQDDVTLDWNGNDLTVAEVDSEDITTLVSVERVAFLEDPEIRGDEMMFALDTEAGEVTYGVYALLNAWFNANPDTATLSRWVAAMDELHQLAYDDNTTADFGDVADAILTYYASEQTDTQIVATLYANIVGSAAPAGVAESYAAQVGEGLAFETIGDLFAFGAMLSMNTNEIVHIIGSMQELDYSYF